MNTQLDKIVQQAAHELITNLNPQIAAMRDNPEWHPNMYGSRHGDAERIIRFAIADAVRESGALQALRQVDEQTDLTSLQAFALANLRALAGETDGGEKEDQT